MDTDRCIPAWELPTWAAVQQYCKQACTANAASAAVLAATQCACMGAPQPLCALLLILQGQSGI